MNSPQRDKMANGHGFIAALDQSGGSTPKALRLYGVPEDAYSGEEQMFDMIHTMRTRIITSPAFSWALAREISASVTLTVVPSRMSLEMSASSRECSGALAA